MPINKSAKTSRRAKTANKTEKNSHKAKNTVELSSEDRLILSASPHEFSEERIVGTLVETEMDVKTLNRTRRLGLYIALAKACIIALALKTDKGDWTAFRNDPVWHGVKAAPKDSDQEDALRYVCRWIFGGIQDSKRASKYYLAGSHLLAEGVLPIDVPRTLKKKGGISKCARLNAALSPDTDAKRPAVQSVRSLIHQDLCDRSHHSEAFVLDVWLQSFDAVARHTTPTESDMGWRKRVQDYLDLIEANPERSALAQLLLE
jgi:hypothetical protein